MQRLLDIDRRWIFLVVVVVVLIGAIARPLIPMPISAESQQLFDMVEAVPERGAIIVAMDYGPASKDELDAMSNAVIHHAFAKNLRVLGVCFDQQGVVNAQRLLENAGNAAHRRDGEDFVFLGFQSDITAAIIQMGESILDVFPEVQVGGQAAATAELLVMRGLSNFKDIALAVEMTGSKDYQKWIDYANARHGLKLGTGATGAIVTGLYPYLSSGQISGLLRSTRGAADYERLVRDDYPPLDPDAGRKMSVQFIAHLMLLIFIALANIGAIMGRASNSTKSAGEEA